MPRLVIDFDPATNLVRVDGDVLGNTMFSYAMLEMAKDAVRTFAQNQVSKAGLVAPNGAPAVLPKLALVPNDTPENPS